MIESNYDVKGLYCEVGDGKGLLAMKQYLLASGLDVAMVAAECEFFR